MNFIDLTELIGTKTTDIKAFTSLPKGALIYADPESEVKAIQEGSPAQEAGLKAEDVILKVEQEDVDSDSTLVELIQDYPIDKCELIIVNDCPFQELVFETIIQRNVKLSEAPSYGENIINYDASSKGAANYLSLAKEIINKNS